MSELKKCPFCESPLDLIKDNSGFGPIEEAPCFSFHDVDCTNPDCPFTLMFESKHYTLDDIRKFINTRPIEDRQSEQIKELEEKLLAGQDEYHGPSSRDLCSVSRIKELEAIESHYKANYPVASAAVTETDFRTKERGAK